MTIPASGLAFEMLIQIKIRGRTYTVRGEESGDTIKSVAQDLDKRMNDLARQLRTSDDYTVAVMTALNLASELQQVRQEMASRLDELDREAATVVAALEAALPDTATA